MPELVEVETTRRDLSKILEDRVINKVSVNLDKIVFNKKEEFIERLTKKRIIRIKRRGKWLLFEFDDIYLIIHFRMEGRFYIKKINEDLDKHDYVIFDFDDFSLRYNDPRLFGTMQIIEKDKLETFFNSKKLGLEYDDISLTAKYLKSKFKNHHIEIKKMLLNQSYITGIGNIYADEILFESKISPFSYCDNLTLKNLDDIIKNTKKVFEKSLMYKGTYPNIDGKRGTFEEHLMVHKRKGMKCFVCGSVINKEKIGSRGTYFCPKCQHVKSKECMY